MSMPSAARNKKGVAASAAFMAAAATPASNPGRGGNPTAMASSLGRGGGSAAPPRPIARGGFAVNLSHVVASAGQQLDGSSATMDGSSAWFDASNVDPSSPSSCFSKESMGSYHIPAAFLMLSVGVFFHLPVPKQTRKGKRQSKEREETNDPAPKQSKKS